MKKNKKLKDIITPNLWHLLNTRGVQGREQKI
jgi:hypothetical protein